MFLDQWSPLNPDGKRKYERDFLLELQNDPQSRKKPENLPDLEVVLKDTGNKVCIRCENLVDFRVLVVTSVIVTHLYSLSCKTLYFRT